MKENKRAGIASRMKKKKEVMERNTGLGATDKGG